MPIINGYTTLENYKLYAGIDPTDTSSDDLIENSINGASRWIDTMTGKRYYQQTLTNFMIDQYGMKRGIRLYEYSNTIYFPGPITNLVSIHENNTLLNLGDDFQVYEDEGKIIKVNSNWTSLYISGQTQGIRLNLDMGYTQAEIPHDLEQVCIQLVSLMSQENQKKLMRDDVSELFENPALPTWCKTWLENNKRIL